MLGDAAVVTVPDEASALSLRPLVAAHAMHELTDPATFAATFAVIAVLGPAHLAYATTETFRPADASVGHAHLDEPVASGHPDVALLLSGVDTDEAGESGWRR